MPRILFLVDRPGWAYDRAARAMEAHLGDRFDVAIRYVVDEPDLNRDEFDLLHVFFWGETYHRQFGVDPRQVVKEISSFRWREEAYGRLTPPELLDTWLRDAGFLTCTSTRLQKLIAPFRPVTLTPNGFDPEIFYDRGDRDGPLRIGWAGNRADPCKGLEDILLPAAGNDFEFAIAGGDLDPAAMGEFYRSIDVLCVASTAEGEPLTLIEAMACGCFPVCVDVGIVPELVEHGRNGLIVERSVAAFRAAFQLCRTDIPWIRRAGHENGVKLGHERPWANVAEQWRAVFELALASDAAGPPPISPARGRNPAGQDRDEVRENNLGENLLEWPERAIHAAALLRALPHTDGGTLLDLGCGRQSVRRFVPKHLSYLPIDRLPRSPDTQVMDLRSERPTGQFEVALVLGLLEYLEDPLEMIDWIAEHATHCVFSYNECANTERRARQRWVSRVGMDELEGHIQRLGGRVLRTIDLEPEERVYAVHFARRPATPRDDRGSTVRKVALFSAAVHGDNSGDALIEDAVRRLLHGCRTERFPLVQQPSGEEIERINACELGIICGTNLYQHVFASGLQPSIIQQLRIPLIPLGVGASAAIGAMPRMDEEGVHAVRMLHERCAVASVRDPLSLEFVNSLGIENVELTGCPVLFHGGVEPRFASRTGTVHVSVRARLLHVDESLNEKQRVTLDRMCAELHPTVVLQSPYDFPLAVDLARRHGVEVVVDTRFQHGALIASVEQAGRTTGFRLHYGMLALSHGVHASFIGTDTRVAEFCEMMGLPWHSVHDYEDDSLLDELRQPVPDMSVFLHRWRELRRAMVRVLGANGLHTMLEGQAERAPAVADTVRGS